MKKRILALLLALLLLLTAGCGKEIPPEDDPGTQPVAPSAEPDPPAEPTAKERAAAILAEMSLEEKVGQMFFIRCPRTSAEETVERFHPGGLLLFKSNLLNSDGEYLTGEEIAANIALYQAASKLPLFIGTDEEGGSVCRVSSNPHLRSERFLSPRTLYAAGGMDAILADCREKDALLLSLGINVNFAPVADVSLDPEDYMYARSLGESPEVTAEVVSETVTRMLNDGVAPVLKHFPGYGSNSDTHSGIAVDDRSLDSFRSCDFLPFSAGIDAGTPFILVSHNIMTAVDEIYPASVSPAVHKLLREELSYDGIVLTDDLAMDAVKAYAEDGSVAVLAALAGNDMIVTTDFSSQIPLIIEAVRQGALSEELIDAAVTRILTAKLRLELME